jgi:nudix-type nucleoside diphosphatase (YffH/AdpP family)
MAYDITGMRVAYEGWTTLSVATIRTPDGDLIKREIEDHGPAVAILPYDPKRGVAMLVRQFRPPVFQAAGETEMLEVPAGLIEDDGPEGSARREVEEEVGLALSKLEPIGVEWSMPGLSTERIHLFLAPYSAEDRKGEGGGLAHEHESIIVEEIALKDLAAQADAGRLADLKTFALLQTLRLRRPELF